MMRLRAILAYDDGIGDSGGGGGGSGGFGSESPKKKKTKEKNKKKGDSLRDATGIRPSLHPTAINCIAEALLLRSRQVLGKEPKNADGDATTTTIDVANPDAEPLQVAITSAGIAMSAIDRRAEASKTDETTDAFTAEESRAISGRVVGAIMRARELERTLATRVGDAGWPLKYGEEGGFGVLGSECQSSSSSSSSSSASSVGGNDEDDDDDEGRASLRETELAEKVASDPLFRMNRAECLLALFLATVEAPKLEMVGEVMPGGSTVDFVDADRLEVLLSA